MKFESKEKENEFFKLGHKITVLLLEIYDLTPKNDKYIEYLCKSVLLFSSFIAFVYDENKQENE